MVACQIGEARMSAGPGIVNGRADPNSGTTAVRIGYELDAEALSRWMRENVAEYEGPLRIEQFRGGQSNPTYKLVTPRRSYVLRRKPSGALPKGAHAVEREYEVLAALARTDVPVAAVHALCRDESVIGTSFYVMDMVEGRIFWDATVPGVTKSERGAIFDAMNDTIARLHRIDFRGIGLGDFGRTGNYFARQIARWTGQYLADEDGGRDPHMDRLIEWLPAHIPSEDESSIVHGDFRIDNMIFHPEKAEVVAVLDWELSTLGHPLADFAYNCMTYRMPPHIVAGLAGADLDTLGIPSEAKYVAAYCARTGRAGIPAFDFYIAFNFFRLAAIFHGIKGRSIRGNASSAQARERARVFPELAELAWTQALQCDRARS